MSIVLIGLVVVPWHSQVGVPAVLRATNYATIFPQSPAKIVEMNVSTGKQVAAGDILYRLSAPDLTFKLRSARDQQRSLEVLIERQAGSLENLDNITVLREQLAASLSTQAGLLSRIERLTLRAPFAGVIKDLALELRPGQWIKADQPLGTLVSMESAELRGYVTSEDVDRIAPGAHGRFLPDDPTRPTMDVIVTELSNVNSTSLDVPMLASTHGGPIAAQPAGRSGVLVPMCGRPLLRKRKV